MMNKLIIFDLDGVLIDSKEIHFNALNLALKEFGNEFIISRDEQNSTFEGLTTKSKLNILTKTKNLPESLHYYVEAKAVIFVCTIYERICRPGTN